MEISKIHALFLQCSGISTDTRKIEANSLFVALKGDNFDANTFAASAIEKGAKYVIIDNADFYIDAQTILVENSLVALQDLAKYHRNYLKLPLIALTGSNGKTTTKELIATVLSKRYQISATKGNLNNHIGVPLTILSFTNETQIGIVEMGANHQKEIGFLCEIATPDFGYITNFGKAHLEGFGGVEGVIKGKSEMYDYLRNNQKLVFVNLDDAIQKEKTTSMNNFSFAIQDKKANVAFDLVEANPFARVSYNDININSNLIGIYNTTNICAAIAIGKYFNVPDLDIKAAIESYTPTNNRSQIITKNSNQIILDAYNANPSSMAVAIANFLQLAATEKLMILGDMFELGEESLKEHRNILNLVTDASVDCHFVGKDFYAVKEQKSNYNFYENFEQLKLNIDFNSIQNKTILIKGSRGMALERIIEDK
jgi:UDP-N-acetylmuramoyl-tripeptide--D-alanyl-D-alanine ligase